MAFLDDPVYWLAGQPRDVGGRRFRPHPSENGPKGLCAHPEWRHQPGTSASNDTEARPPRIAARHTAGLRKGIFFQPAARRFDAGRVIVNLRRRGATPTTAVCGLGKTARRRRRGVRWPAGGADGTDQSASHTHSNRPLVGSAQGEQPERPDGRVHHPPWWSAKAGRQPAELGDRTRNNSAVQIGVSRRTLPLSASLCRPPWGVVHRAIRAFRLFCLRAANDWPVAVRVGR